MIITLELIRVFKYSAFCWRNPQKLTKQQEAFQCLDIKTCLSKSIVIKNGYTSHMCVRELI